VTRHNALTAALTVAILFWAPGSTFRSAKLLAQDPAARLPATIPIFPLQDVVLFPNAARPLHIFEPRYRAMIADALEGDHIIGMILLQPGYEAEYEGRPPIYEIGCAGIISDVEKLPDGRYNILLQGLVKFRVVSEDRSRPYRVAAVEPLPEVLNDSDRMTLDRRRGRLEELLAALIPNLNAPPTLPAERLVDGVAQLLEIAPPERQALLELEGPLPRAEAIIKRLEGRLARPL